MTTELIFDNLCSLRKAARWVFSHHPAGRRGMAQGGGSRTFAQVLKGSKIELPSGPAGVGVGMKRGAEAKEEEKRSVRMDVKKISKITMGGKHFEEVDCKW